MATANRLVKYSRPLLQYSQCYPRLQRNSSDQCGVWPLFFYLVSCRPLLGSFSIQYASKSRLTSGKIKLGQTVWTRTITLVSMERFTDRIRFLGRTVSDVHSPTLPPKGRIPVALCRSEVCRDTLWLTPLSCGPILHAMRGRSRQANRGL